MVSRPLDADLVDRDGDVGRRTISRTHLYALGMDQTCTNHLYDLQRFVSPDGSTIFFPIRRATYV